MTGKQLIYLALLFFIILMGIGNAVDTVDLVFNIFIFLFISIVIFLRFFNKIKLSNWTVLPVIIIFIITSFLNSNSLRTYLKQEPINRTYRTDMDNFLKTYYLMKNGNDFYSSYRIAVEQNAFKINISYNLWSWRFPTLHYLWTLIPVRDGRAIYGLYVGLASVIMYFSYQISAKLLSKKSNYLAILSPYLLYPYLHYSVRDPTFLQTEWWGIFIFIIGINLWLHSRKRFALSIFLVAALVRELFILPLFILGIYFLIKKNSLWKTVLLMGCLWLASLVCHQYFVSQQVVVTSDFLTPRIHIIGKDIILATFAFGSWEYIFFEFRLFIICYLLAGIGIVKNWNKDSIILLSCFLFPVSFLFIGSSIYNDYWGIFFIPVVFITLPLILNQK